MPRDCHRQLDRRSHERLAAYRRRRGAGSAKKWGEYAAAAGAAIAGASTADAAIVHVVPPDPIRAVLGGASYAYTSIDLNADGQIDLSFSLVRSTSSSFSQNGGSVYSFSSRSVQVEAIGRGGADFPMDNRGRGVNFASGEAVSSGLVFDNDVLVQGGFSYYLYTATTGGRTATSSSAGDFGNFPANGTGLLGVRFNAASGAHLAWVRVSLEDVDELPGIVEVLEWAFEDTPNTPILAGATSAIPEPAGLALLAAGAAGVACLRRH